MLTVSRSFGTTLTPSAETRRSRYWTSCLNSSRLAGHSLTLSCQRVLNTTCNFSCRIWQNTAHHPGRIGSSHCRSNIPSNTQLKSGGAFYRPKGILTHSNRPHVYTTAKGHKYCQLPRPYSHKLLVVSFTLVEYGEPRVSTQGVHEILDLWQRMAISHGFLIKLRQNTIVMRHLFLQSNTSGLA